VGSFRRRSRIESSTIESLTIVLIAASASRFLPNPARGPAQRFLPFDFLLLRRSRTVELTLLARRSSLE
jgi:hypothetical protein